MPRIVNKEERQTALAMAAMAVFAEQGYHGATMQAVAERAGVSKGGLYDYFPSKEALLLHLAAWLVSDMTTSMDQALEQPGPIAERVERFLTVGLASVDAWSDAAFAVLRLWAELKRDEEQPLRTLLAGIYDRTTTQLESTLDAAVARGEVAPFPTRAAALAMLAALDGCLLQAVLAPDDFRMARESGVFVRMLTSVLQPLPGEAVP